MSGPIDPVEDPDYKRRKAHGQEITDPAELEELRKRFDPEEQLKQAVADGTIIGTTVIDDPDPGELRRYRAHLAFWAVRGFNAVRQRKKKFRRTMTYVRTRQPKGGGDPIVVSRRQGLSGRQWVMRRKELNKLLRAQQERASETST